METAEVKALPSMDARCPRGLLTLHSWIPTMRKNRGALWTTETRAVGAVIYDRPGKCFGFMRTPPSHPHSAFAQRNRFTSHSTLITRSSGLRGIRRVVLPQRGQSTGTPIATLSSSARERQSPLLIEPPTAWCREHAPDPPQLRSGRPPWRASVVSYAHAVSPAVRSSMLLSNPQRRGDRYQNERQDWQSPTH
jgi:hypothetical protein